MEIGKQEILRGFLALQSQVSEENVLKPDILGKLF
jgi:hypothetical protein